MEIHYDPDRKRWYAHISFEVSEKAVREEWISVQGKPKGKLATDIDTGVNNLIAAFTESSLRMA